MSSVLVVVHDSLLRFAVVSYLRFQGYSPVEASDARSALGCAKTHSIEAILLDVYPVSERLALLQEIRLHPSLKHTPVIALITSPNRLESLDKLGPVEYLELPFEMPMLTWMLENLVSGSRYSQVGLAYAFGVQREY